MSAYDFIARLYDSWCYSVTEDVQFYVDQALADGGPLIELGVGTGRIAVPIAAERISVIGIDSSPAMLTVCRERAHQAGVSEFLDLRLGDLRQPPVSDRVTLVICPFRAFMHLADDRARLAALRAAGQLLLPGGRLIFDVFAPTDDDIADTNGRWIEREPGIFERADWDKSRRCLTLCVRDDHGEGTMELTWVSASEWVQLLTEAGFCVDSCFGSFDREPYRGGANMIWITSVPSGRPTGSRT